MPQMMKAFVMKRVGEVGVLDKPIPEPGPNDAIIRTTAALICTSDAHTVGGAIGERTDITLGHEAVGVVHRLGTSVRGFKEGDRVAVNAITPCFQYDKCLRGYTSQCQQMLGAWKFANASMGTSNVRSGAGIMGGDSLFRIRTGCGERSYSKLSTAPSLLLGASGLASGTI